MLLHTSILLASRSYLSTLAVLQLDAILTNAKTVSTVCSKNNGNQKPFEKMIIMKYDCVGIGLIKMTVGGEDAGLTKKCSIVLLR